MSTQQQQQQPHVQASFSGVDGGNFTPPPPSHHLRTASGCFHGNNHANQVTYHRPSVSCYSSPMDTALPSDGTVCEAAPQHHSHQQQFPQPLCAGSNSNDKSITEVFDPEFKFIYDVPTRCVVHLPPARLNITRLVLCRNYACGEPGSCGMGHNCKFVHADCSYESLEAHPIHVNYIWQNAEFCTYLRVSDCLLAQATPHASSHERGKAFSSLQACGRGPETAVFEVEQCDGRGPIERIPATHMLRTRAFDAILGVSRLSTAAASEERVGGGRLGGKTEPVLMHCESFYCHRMCKQGERCHRVHALVVDPSIRASFKRAPARRPPSRMNRFHHAHGGAKHPQQLHNGNNNSNTNASQRSFHGRDAHSSPRTNASFSLTPPHRQLSYQGEDERANDAPLRPAPLMQTLRVGADTLVHAQLPARVGHHQQHVDSPSLPSFLPTGRASVAAPATAETTRDGAEDSTHEGIHAVGLVHPLTSAETSSYLFPAGASASLSFSTASHPYHATHASSVLGGGGGAEGENNGSNNATPDPVGSARLRPGTGTRRNASPTPLNQSTSSHVHPEPVLSGSFSAFAANSTTSVGSLAHLTYHTLTSHNASLTNYALPTCLAAHPAAPSNPGNPHIKQGGHHSSSSPAPENEDSRHVLNTANAVPAPFPHPVPRSRMALPPPSTHQSPRIDNDEALLGMKGKKSALLAPPSTTAATRGALTNASPVRIPRRCASASSLPRSPPPHATALRVEAPPSLRVLGASTTATPPPSVAHEHLRTEERPAPGDVSTTSSPSLLSLPSHQIGYQSHHQQQPPHQHPQPTALCQTGRAGWSDSLSRSTICGSISHGNLTVTIRTSRPRQGSPYAASLGSSNAASPAIAPLHASSAAAADGIVGGSGCWLADTTGSPPSRQLQGPQALSPYMKGREHAHAAAAPVALRPAAAVIRHRNDPYSFENHVMVD